MSTTALKSLYAYKTWADAELTARLAELTALPDDARHTAVRTLNHIHVVDRIFRAHLAGEPRPFDATNTRDTPTLEQLRADMAETDAWYERHVAGLAPQALAETLAFAFTDGDRGSMTREEILLHVIAHGTYHRGNVGQVMKSHNLVPPRDLLTRYLHQLEPQRREA